MTTPTDQPTLTFVNEDAIPSPMVGHARVANEGARVANELAPLREAPGQWARLTPPRHVNLPSNINAGRYENIAPGEFEALGRNQRLAIDDEGRMRTVCDVYVRYVGSPN